MILQRGVAILGFVAILSIAVNLFLVGDLLGHQFHRPAPGQEFDARLTAVIRDIPDADRKLAQEVMDQHRDILLEKWRAARTAGQHAALSLKATPFEMNDAKADMARWNDRILDSRAAFQDTIIDIAGKISPEGRTQLRLGPGQ